MKATAETVVPVLSDSRYSRVRNTWLCSCLAIHSFWALALWQILLEKRENEKINSRKDYEKCANFFPQRLLLLSFSSWKVSFQGPVKKQPSSIHPSIHPSSIHIITVHRVVMCVPFQAVDISCHLGLFIVREIAVSGSRSWCCRY